MTEDSEITMREEPMLTKDQELSGLDEKEIQFDARRLRIRRAAKAFSENTHAN